MGIKTDKLRKCYGSTKAVDDISLEIPQGSFFGILGPNGAGKTTLLELIEGIREPDSGSAEILGQKSWPRNKDLLPNIGVQLQAQSFFKNLSVMEQITMVADLYDAPRQRCKEMLDLVGLGDRPTLRTEKLSGGQAQRLSTACSLVHNPDVVFLDEPTSALDPQSRRNLWDILRAANQDGKTIVLTTHSMEEAEVLCGEVAIMDHGRILAKDSPIKLMESIGSSSKADGQAVTLEDVFLSLTGREYRV